jgi:hypothetical protein
MVTRMTRSKRLSIIIFSFLLVIFAIWFGWMSFREARTEWVETKVEQALVINTTTLSPQWPRIEMHVAQEIYYSPIVDANQTFELYRYVLEYLNQDESVPPIKLTQLSHTIEFGSSEDTLVWQVKLDFPLFLGIDRKDVVLSKVAIPHYTTIK